MKIGVDIRTLTDSHYSGVSEYTFNLVAEILKQDPESEFRLFCNSARAKRLPDFKAPNCQIIKYNYPNKIFNYLLQKGLAYPKIDRRLGVDIFFMPHFNFIALSPQAKLVLTVHDLSFMRYPRFFSRRKNFWHKMINLKRLLKRCDRVVAVSQNTKHDLIELCQVPAEKIEVIYSGLNSRFRVIEASDANLRRVKEKYDLPDKFILFLGNLEPRKNIESIISAFERLAERSELADYNLIIAGGNGWKNRQLFKLWRQARERNRIKFLGYVAAEDKVYLYNLAKLFVYPSFYEGFGFPPLEAMASGTPVIASAVSSLPEVMGNAALTVDPFNLTELAEAVAEILNSEELAGKLRAAGLIQAKRFSWQEAAKKYLELFKNLGV